MTESTINPSVDWSDLSQDWQDVEVDTAACMDIVHSVRRHSRMMLSGVVVEFLALGLVLGLLFWLSRFVPLTDPLMIWALIGLLMSLTAVGFKVRNAAGLWRSQAESTIDMLKLSERRIEAIARTARFNRRLTLAFFILLPLWGFWVMSVQPAIWTARPVVSVGILVFVVLWLGGFWVFTGRAMQRSRAQLAAIATLRQEYSD